MNVFVRSLILAGAVALASCTSPSGETGDEQRTEIESMRRNTLETLYEREPTARAKIDGAAGHAVFSNVGVQIFFVGGGSGFGVAVDHATGKHTYMKMGELSAGLGLGLKDFRAVFYFDTQEALTTFVDSGWEFGGSADASAKSNEKGGAAAAKGTAAGAIHVYQLTETGVSLQATVNGTKYWKADSLN
jgi:lipid-binding SYLF domain-containing protein